MKQSSRQEEGLHVARQQTGSRAVEAKQQIEEAGLHVTRQQTGNRTHAATKL